MFPFQTPVFPFQPLVFPPQSLVFPFQTPVFSFQEAVFLVQKPVSLVQDTGSSRSRGGGTVLAACNVAEVIRRSVSVFPTRNSIAWTGDTPG